MTSRNCKTDIVKSPAQSSVTGLPAPRVNLHDVDSVRREMSKVYRDMRMGAIPTQDGTRLVYVLAEIGKMFVAVELEGRISLLEQSQNAST